VNALSPSPYLYWSVVTGPVLLAGWRQTPAIGLGFLIAFYATMIAALVAIILVFGLARKLGPRTTHAMLGISALALFAFGLYQLVLGVTGIWPVS
jgi:hypothetical protein